MLAHYPTEVTHHQQELSTAHRKGSSSADVNEVESLSSMDLEWGLLMDGQLCQELSALTVSACSSQKLQVRPSDEEK